MKKVLLAAVLAVGAFAAAPASALPVAKVPGVDATNSMVDNVAWYCNGRGHCVQSVRPGYVVRGGWAPGCAASWRWDGYRCVGPRVVVRPARPAVVVRTPGIVVRVP